MVFKQASTLYEFWEAALVPFEHYIPVNADFSDLTSKIEWALQVPNLLLSAVFPARVVPGLRAFAFDLAVWKRTHVRQRLWS